MPCPLFLPPESGNSPSGPSSVGGCASAPGLEVARETVRSCCLPGYARLRCARAALSPADAVQVAVKSDTDRGVLIAWSRERDHHPLDAGISGGTDPRTGDPALDAQIRACRAAYLDFKQATAQTAASGEARLPRP